MSGVLGFIIIIASIVAYWAPTIVAASRHVPNRGSVIVINLFLGWTVIGWVIALAMACRSKPAVAAGPPMMQIPPQQYGRHRG